MKRSTSVTLRTAAVLLVVLSFLQCMGLDVGLVRWFLVIWSSLAGWISFIARVRGQIQVRWDLVSSAAVYAMVLLVGSHLFFAWLYREMTPQNPGDVAAPRRRFKWRWTISGFLPVLLMFCAGIAMIGVVHQSTWLARSLEPMFHRRGIANRIPCASNLRLIGYACLWYANSHEGRFPDDLSALLGEKDVELSPEALICPALEAEWIRRARGDADQPAAARQQKVEEFAHHPSYFYFGKGRTNTMTSEEVLALEVPSNHEGEGSNVLFGDGHVEWLTEPALGDLLVKLGFERVEYVER